MKEIFKTLGTNRKLIIFAIILQVLIVILIINPFAIIAQNSMNGILNQVVTLSNDNDFKNASILKVTSSETFKKQYLLNDSYSKLSDNDYLLVVNDKLIIYRPDEDKIVFQGQAPSSMLDSTRLALLISLTAKASGSIKDDEIPAIKIYDESADKDKYSDISKNLTGGDILVFFAQNKVILVYNLQTDKIKEVKKFSLQ